MKEIKLYSTLSNQKEVFIPLEEGKVKIYLCGPTVYDLLHIGNFRGAIVYNFMRNWLEHVGYKVTFVYNYTDVDDKIINRAKDEGVKASEISERFIKEFEADFNRLGLRKHDYNPKVTEFIPQIVSFIETLVKKEKAYEVSGEVFYSIDSFNNYGKLSGKKLDELELGKRIEVDKKKQNPHDFVLWKPSKEGEPSWPSPWGEGRPGWHIECSAMIKEILGDTIDIHGGGIDLIFPHHENEIAQSEGLTEKPYCRYWVHNNFINLKDQKMSKSLGNVIRGREFMDKFHPEILKFLNLGVHYRTLLNIDDERINQTVMGLVRIYNALRESNEVIEKIDASSGKVNTELSEKLKELDLKIENAMADDINTGEVISAFFEAVRFTNSLNLKKGKNPDNKASAQEFKNWILKYGKMMALFQERPKDFLAELNEIYLREKSLTSKQIDELIAKRNEARISKDFAQSDKFRDELISLGIEVYDTPEGSRWGVKLS